MKGLKSCVLTVLVFLCVSVAYCSTNEHGVTQLMPQLDCSNNNTRSLDGRAIERYTHDSGSNAQANCFYVVAPKKPRNNAPLYVVLHSANRTALDYLGYQFLNRKAGEGDNPSDVVMHVPDDFYGLFLNSNNDEWWGWGIARADAEKYSDTPTPVEKRVLDSIEWVAKHYKIDRNRIYLCGVSMGGCGTLGIGMPHGDIFASICAWVPAGTEYFAYRMGLQSPSSDSLSQLKQKNVWRKDGLPDPPPAVDIFGQDDTWSQTQNTLLDAANSGQLSLVAGWGPFGHGVSVSHIRAYPQCEAAREYPWLEIRKNEAYPVFTNATSNQLAPKYNVPEDKNFDKTGQINACFRWKNQKDKSDLFTIRLWIEHPKVQEDKVSMPDSATADVTLRRLQHFKVQAGEYYAWQITRNRKIMATGKATPGSTNLLTISKVSMSTVPVELSVRRINRSAD